MSLPIDDTLAVLRDHIKDQTVLKQIAQDLIAAEKEAKESKVTTPKGKTRLVALVRHDGGSLVGAGAYIVSVPDDDTTDTYSKDGLLNRLRKAAQEYNDSPRKRRAKGKPVKIETWTDLFRNVKAKTLKASGSNISIKAKGDPVELVVLEKETIAP
jgi:hypothetical protein